MQGLHRGACNTSNPVTTLGRVREAPHPQGRLLAVGELHLGFNEKAGSGQHVEWLPV